MYKVFLLITALTFSWAVQAEEDDPVVNAREIQLQQLPPGVLEAARKAKPDVYFKSAEATHWKDEPTYIVKGVLPRQAWSVYVSSTGRVMHITSNWLD